MTAVKPDLNTMRSDLQQAFKLLQSGDDITASEIFAKYVSDDTIDDVESLTLLAELATRLGEKIIAINIYYELVERLPESYTHVLGLSQAYIDNSMLEQGEKWARRALQIDPENYRVYVKLSYIAMQTRKYDAAVELLEKARELKPSEPAIYNNLVTALIQTNRPEEGLKYATRLLKMVPGNAMYHHLYGRALIGVGKFDEAIRAYEKAIQLNKTFGNSYYDIATSRKFSLSDEKDVRFIRKAEKVLNEGMSAADRAAIHYTLGKVYNDCKEYDKALENYSKGNLIRKPAVAKTLEREFYDGTSKLFNSAFYEKYSNISNESPVPVFVVGMPRSGSTLLEQIISSHPDACGAGELIAIDRVAKNIFQASESDDYKTALIDACENGLLQEQEAAYLELLHKECGDASRVVDKQLENFKYIGLILLMYPNAHIFHAIRSPLDTALSCFFQQFESLDWSNDFELIAKYYREYREVMSAWDKVLPAGRIVDVHYEKLSSDPETEARRIIEAIGLDWHPDCLDFHKTDRAINTASFWQVRQPMYTTSQKRWLNYAKHLQGFANDIYDYLDESDIDAFAQKGIKLKKKGWLTRLLG